ncbi:MAG: hypothetical protein J1D88_07025 [Treponema sp.]|nr:hypothetical protein [Treponema sp.]
MRHSLQTAIQPGIQKKDGAKLFMATRKLLLLGMAPQISLKSGTILPHRA